MTKITYLKTNNCYDITVSGHAGYNTGLDIVCSAVSVLTFTLLNAIGREHVEGLSIRSEENAAEVRLRFTAPEEEADRISAIAETVILGYELLADQYPDNVELCF